MRFQISDFNMLANFLDSAIRNGADYMFVSADYVIKHEDLKVIALSYNGQYFLPDKNPSKYAYKMSDVKELLNKIHPQNENIRPFIKYNNDSKDFFIDLDKMYKVHDRINKLNLWHDLRKEFLQNNPFLAKTGDAAFVEIINNNLKRLCDFDGGYVFALDWLRSNPDKAYSMPQKFPVYDSMQQRRLTYDAVTSITKRISYNKEWPANIPRKKM